MAEFVAVGPARSGPLPVHPRLALSNAGNAGLTDSKTGGGLSLRVRRPSDLIRHFWRHPNMMELVVFSSRHWAQVPWVHAQTNLAKMVQFYSICEASEVTLPKCAMSKPMLEPAVSIGGSRTEPNPTSSAIAPVLLLPDRRLLATVVADDESHWFSLAVSSFGASFRGKRSKFSTSALAIAGWIGQRASFTLMWPNPSGKEVTCG